MTWQEAAQKTGTCYRHANGILYLCWWDGDIRGIKQGRQVIIQPFSPDKCTDWEPYSEKKGTYVY